MADFKTIVLPITFVSLDGAASEPMVYDQNYAVVSGKTVLVHHEAGTPLKLPAAIADDYLARYRDAGAKEIDGDGVDIAALAKGSPMSPAIAQVVAVKPEPPKPSSSLPLPPKPEAAK